MSSAKKLFNPKNLSKVKSIYEYNAIDLEGVMVHLEKYRGHVCIIVNVASDSPYTKTNYEELNYLYEQFAESKGLKILAFPCNQFGDQEPGTSEDIRQFVDSRNVQFDIFKKVNVNGHDAHPLWKYLQHKQGGDSIKGNFTKFIINQDGQPVERHGPSATPKDLVDSLEKYW